MYLNYQLKQRAGKKKTPLNVTISLNFLNLLFLSFSHCFQYHFPLKGPLENTQEFHRTKKGSTDRENSSL